MEELDRQEEFSITPREAPPPSAIEQMMPLIGMVMTVVMLGAMVEGLGEAGGG